MTIYILNKDLKVEGIAESLKSLIWNNRYWDIGDFELALPTTADYINLCKKGFYVRRDDDDMIGIIEKIEIDTTYDGENLLIVSGRDATSILDRRTMIGYRAWGDSARVESYIAFLVNRCCIDPDGWSTSDTPSPTDLKEYRKEKKLDGTLLIEIDTANLPKTCALEKRWANLSETIQEICKSVAYGFRMKYQGGKLHFSLYDGADKSDQVYFTPEYDNISTTKYIDDSKSYKNVGYVVGNGTFTPLLHIAIYDLSDSHAPISSTNRYETAIDAKNIPRVLTVADIKKMFPNSTTSPSGTELLAPGVSIQIYTPSQKQYLIDSYVGTISVVDGTEFFNFTTNIKVADLLDNSAADNARAALASYIYDAQLYEYAVQYLANKKMLTQFEGTVIPNVTYRYRQDYNLGDIVTVRNEYGIEAQARIVEVLEVFDGSGYSIEPKFEYLSG